MFQRFTDLSQTFVASSDTKILFNPSNLPGQTSDFSSLSGESAEIVRYVRYKLGEPVLTVELDNAQIVSEFEFSTLEYSRVVSLLQINNYFTSIMGLSKDYTTHDLKNILPTQTFNFMMRYTKNFGVYGPEPVGGGVDVRRGYVDLIVGQQRYDLYNDLRDMTTNQILHDYVRSNSLSAAGYGVFLTKLHHYPPVTLYRYFDPWSSVNTLSQELNFESFTMESTFHVMPVWNDIARAQIFKQSDLVRRSNFSFNQLGRTIIFYPAPKQSLRIYFEYFQSPDALTDPNAESGTEDPTYSGINAFWNVPMTDVNYTDLNPMSRQFIREFTTASCRESLGLIRSKFSSIPIPNGDVTLNGTDLISQGREDMQRLRDELKEQMDQFKLENLMTKETTIMQQVNEQLKMFPLGGPSMG